MCGVVYHFLQSANANESAAISGASEYAATTDSNAANAIGSTDSNDIATAASQLPPWPNVASQLASDEWTAASSWSSHHITANAHADQLHGECATSSASHEHGPFAKQCRAEYEHTGWHGPTTNGCESSSIYSSAGKFSLHSFCTHVFLFDFEAID